MVKIETNEEREIYYIVNYDVSRYDKKNLGRLGLEDATLTDWQTKVIYNDLIYRYIVKNFLSLKKALSLNLREEKILSNSYIEHAIEKEVFDIGFALKLSDEQIFVFSRYFIPLFVERGILTLEEALNLTTNDIDFFIITPVRFFMF